MQRSQTSPGVRDSTADIDPAGGVAEDRSRCLWSVSAASDPYPPDPVTGTTPIHRETVFRPST